MSISWQTFTGFHEFDQDQEILISDGKHWAIFKYEEVTREWYQVNDEFIKSNMVNYAYYITLDQALRGIE